MKKIKKFIKVNFIIFIITFSILACSFVIFYHTTTSGISLNENKFLNNKTNIVSIFDNNGNLISSSNNRFIPISKLSNETKYAFICAEDNRFYKHNGIDYIRIAKATLSNIKSKSYSEGASTITQQLIKNTQLTNEKTIKRKLKEIKLASELEKKYTKDQILEMYLNNIYFGNGCYGIENASWHYYSKSSSKLTLSESASLAAIINAPSIFDIENNPQKVKNRRDLILKLMQKNNKISEIQYQNAKNDEIILNLSPISNNELLIDLIIKEACGHLKISPNSLINQNYKIYTDLDINLLNKIKNIINSSYSNLENSPNIASIIINNKTNQIISITGSKTSLLSKKQPGSTIKPVLVFAPAIENNLISPSTILIDEPINISGYTPTNAGGTYHGNISAKEALINSYNIPAVKLLNEIGISNAQSFAKNLGIKFEDSDNNLAIALGGFTFGTTLKTLADTYSAFANNGKFNESKFITKITKNDNLIYKHTNENKVAMKDSTAFLITDMLCESSKTGTAKRLKDFNFQIASKTGTVGEENSSNNKETFNISYTNNHTIITYIGGVSMPQSINGSTYATMLVKDIFDELYKNIKPQKFNIPKSVKLIELNDKTKEYFSKDNLPKSNLIKPNKISAFNFENKKPIIEFSLPMDYSYEIIRKQKDEEQIISSSKNDINNTNSKISYEDTLAVNDSIYEYYVNFKNIKNDEIIESNHIILKSH